MGFKTSNPYDANYDVKNPVEAITAERAQAGSKAKARYPHKPLMPDQDNGQAGKVKIRAYTPGGPKGS